jgi:endonuclease/exonuclease/phosphatase (EEP) superfamily protein YafD
MDLLQTAATALGSVTIAFTAVPLVRASAWWIRIFDFPRLQVTLLGTAALAAFLARWDPSSAWQLAFVLLLAAALAHQAFMMFPYTLAARRQVEQARKPTRGHAIKIVFANVLMTNRDATRLLSLIEKEDPDIVLAVETDSWWIRELEPLARRRPYAVRQPQDNTYGMALYSRLELVEPQVKLLVQKDVPSIRAKIKLGCGELVELWCLHPRPPTPPEAQDSKPRDRELMLVALELEEKRDPAIVLGDLNDVAWSRTNYRFQEVSGLLDPRIGRGFFHTFHARYPFLRYPLDHCFHSRHFRLVSFRRLRAFGSDHFPVYICLNFEPDAG